MLELPFLRSLAGIRPRWDRPLIGRRQQQMVPAAARQRAIAAPQVQIRVGVARRSKSLRKNGSSSGSFS